ncbi:Conserved_hypothetical protein [Hexamita inflata]|uniref:Uncharacterized protein n=1 Tax=Hexamita inflata TaxID=28002 RepID=A0AA86PXI9_9EUKA|nr:Conserved hypothetical protein [Hexamita inflata]
MIGLDLGNYNAILAKLVGNETSTIMDSTGMRQIPTSIRYDNDHRQFKSRSSKSETNFMHKLETAMTIPDQMKQCTNIFGFIQFLKSDIELQSKILMAYPSHQSYYTRCMLDSILKANFSYAQLVPAHLCVAAQYFFRRYTDIQAKPLKFAFIQVNEFDSVYASFQMYRDNVTTKTYKVLPFGSSNFDQMLFQMCQMKNPYLKNYDMNKSLSDIKKAKISLSLEQDTSVTFPDFDVRIKFTEFMQYFQQYQSQLLQCIESDVTCLELLGGGARLLVLPDCYKKIQTKRMNPDEVLAQGALVYYLLSSQKKMVVSDLYQSQTILLGTTQLTGPNMKYPAQTTLKTNFAENSLIQMCLPNKFVIKEWKILKKKTYFNPQIVVTFNYLQEVEIDFKDYEVQETFSCVTDKQLLDTLNKAEVDLRLMDKKHLEDLLEQERVDQSESQQPTMPEPELNQPQQNYPAQQQPKNEPYVQQNQAPRFPSHSQPQEYQQQQQQQSDPQLEEAAIFVEQVRQGEFEKYMNVMDMKMVDRLLNEQNQSSLIELFNTEIIQNIINRRKCYVNWKEKLQQLESYAQDKMKRVSEHKKKYVEKYVKQVKDQVFGYIKSGNGHLVVAELLDTQGVDQAAE